MSGPTIRFGDPTIIPDVSIASDAANTLEITDINDFDLGYLGNKQKLSSTPPRNPSPGTMNLSSTNDGIEFVNLEDTNTTFQIKPPASNGDTIRILRDGPANTSFKPIENPIILNSGNSGSSSAFQPIRPTPLKEEPVTTTQPQAAKSWFSNLTDAKPAAENTGVRSWFGGATETNTETIATARTEYLTPEQEAVKKTEALTILERMDRKGISGTKMSMANSYEEIQAELAKRKDSKGLEASLRFQRSMLTTVTSGMEFLNNRYDPVGVSLDGWSEQINENLEDYDEIFEELYDKYKDRSKVAPEVRLIMSLGLSAAMCHVTNTMFKSRMPGMDDILRKNPDLARQMAQAAAEQAVGPGFANFVSMGMNKGPSNSAQSAPQYNSMPAASNDTFMNSGSPAQTAPTTPNGNPTARREMRGPTGVEDILEKLNNAGEQLPQRAVPRFDADDVASVASGVTTDTMRRNGMSRRRRTNMQPVGTTLTLNV